MRPPSPATLRRSAPAERCTSGQRQRRRRAIRRPRRRCLAGRSNRRGSGGRAANARPGEGQGRKAQQERPRRRKIEERRIKAFRDYFDYGEEIKKIPPHRVLAINRGERAKVLRVKIECDMEAMYAALDEILVPPGHPHADYLRGCARDALSRLILPAWSARPAAS